MSGRLTVSVLTQRLIGLSALSLIAAAEAGEMPPGWDKVMAEAVPIQLDAYPVKPPVGKFSGLSVEGAWVLESDADGFGGLSGLVVRDGVLYAVSDHAHWFSARLHVSDGALYLEDPVLAPIRTTDGEVLDPDSGDAEGLTWYDGHLAVSMERDPRMMVLGDSGGLGMTLRSDLFAGLPSNEGLEALATLPDGRLIAFAEKTNGLDIPAFVMDPVAGTVVRGTLRRRTHHVATGADVDPDGNLYVLGRSRSRYFWRILGSGIRVTRYQTGSDGFPIPDTVETMASFDEGSGIDNMESLAVEMEADGTLHLWLLSDDNFSRWENTLLLRFLIIQSPGAAAVSAKGRSAS